MNLCVTNPLTDNRWEKLVDHHPRASAFHRRGWIEALARTYGYKPVVVTSAPAGEPLNSGIVLCLISSWITGTRLVSLPFADHCEPLVSDVDEAVELISWTRAERERQRWKYVEVRPLFQDVRYGQSSRSYYFHQLDLTPSLEQIFRTLHKDSIQRSIRRAEREQLLYETGTCKTLVDEFYRLMWITRRRHGLLAQPRIWFEHLVQCMGGNAQIRVARKNGRAIAAMLTLQHRSTMVYKYGCSDQKFHNLGGMPFLFWRLIEESKSSGLESLDLGRSDLDNEGLITFKDRFGTEKRLLTYYRHPRADRPQIPRWQSQVLRELVSVLPDVVLSNASRVFYKQMG